MALVLLLSVSTAGCLDPFRPHVDEAILDASGHDWRVTESPQRSSGLFAPNIVETEYRFDPESSGAPFPGVLLILGIRGLTRADPDDLLERTRDVLNDALAEQGVEVDPDQGGEGRRTLENGAGTRWFFLVGAAQNDDGLFGSEEEVRALGETWYDGRSNTAVITVAMAQTTGSTFLGGEERDHAVWNELVGDPNGSVGGAINENGFIHHMVSHG